jgi:hypothetical protein
VEISFCFFLGLIFKKSKRYAGFWKEKLGIDLFQVENSNIPLNEWND